METLAAKGRRAPSALYGNLPSGNLPSKRGIRLAAKGNHCWDALKEKHREVLFNIYAIRPNSSRRTPMTCICPAARLAAFFCAYLMFENPPSTLVISLVMPDDSSDSRK